MQATPLNSLQKLFSVSRCCFQRIAVMVGLLDLTSIYFTQMAGPKKPGLSVYGEFRFRETCFLSRRMGVRSSRLAISVFVHWDWSGKSITETDLDFTF